MASTYTTRLRLEKQANGENDTTWGTKMNTVLDLVDAAIAGSASVTHDDTASYTLTANNSASDEARCAVLVIGGTLTAARNVVCPTQTKDYIIKNNTTGGYAVTLKTSGGTGISVPNGRTMWLRCDGTNVIDAFDQMNLNTLAVSSALSLLGLNLSPYTMKNRIINPGCHGIDQRGLSTVSDDSYAFDRWNILTQTGAVTPSVLTDPENGYAFGFRLTQAQASDQRFGFSQIIESRNCRDLRGASVCLVPRIRCSSSQAIRYAILEWTGTADSVTSDIVNDWTSGTYTTGNFFTSTTTTLVATGTVTPSANAWTSLTALTGTVSSSMNNLIVFVWTQDTAAQNVTLDWDYVQLEEGAVATDPEFRPFSVELDLCQYYTRRWPQSGNGSLGSGGAYGISDAYFTVQRPPMRVAPTVTISGTINCYSLGSQIASPTITAASITNGSYYIRANKSSGFTSGAFGLIETSSSSDYILEVAEL